MSREPKDPPHRIAKDLGLLDRVYQSQTLSYEELEDLAVKRYWQRRAQDRAGKSAA